MAVYETIIELLEEAAVEYRTFEHEPVRTSEQAAAVRGTPLECGAKALVLQRDEDLILVVISAARKVDYKALKAAFGTRRVQMAPPDRVMDATGCEPGGVPPFGHLFGLPVYVDRSLLLNERIAFNAGERTRSIEMRAEDWHRLSGAQVLDFAQEGAGTARHDEC